MYLSIGHSLGHFVHLAPPMEPRRLHHGNNRLLMSCLEHERICLDGKTPGTQMQGRKGGSLVYCLPPQCLQKTSLAVQLCARFSLGTGTADLLKLCAPGEARTHNLRMAHSSCTDYKYGALTDCATGAGKPNFRYHI